MVRALWTCNPEGVNKMRARGLCCFRVMVRVRVDTNLTLTLT